MGMCTDIVGILRNDGKFCGITDTMGFIISEICRSYILLETEILIFLLV